MRFLLFLSLFFGVVVSCSAQAAAVDHTRLARLLERGRETNSDAVIVIQSGRILAEEYYGKPKGAVYIASAGKSLTSLAVGKLLDEGKIKSLDQAVSDFYPEWLQGSKKSITIRMLLSHTSGIQNVPNASIEIERKSPPVNAIKLALAAELSDRPGATFSYNNKAVGLLGGIIERASGMRMDLYFEKSFYKPMNIKQYDWIRDEDGNPAAYGAFIIEPIGLAKIGLLMLNGGEFQGKQILSRSFVDEALKPSQSLFSACGLLWWRYSKFSTSVIDTDRFTQMRKDGVDEDFLRKIRPLANIVFESNEAYAAELRKTLGKDWVQQVQNALQGVSYSLRKRKFSDDVIGYYASGFRGNYLLVMPKAKLVAVRVVRNDSDYNWGTDGYSDFLQLAAGLTGEEVPQPPVQ